MKLFISFSSQDRPSVRELMAGFKSQNIDFWDYSNDIDEIKSGEVILERLTKEINSIDFFVAIISNSSTDPEIGKFTRLEVQYAINQGMLESGKIIPIALQRKGDHLIQYIGPYKELESLLHHNFEVQNSESYFGILRAITNRLQISYIPIIEEHPRMPFWGKFRNEVMALAQSNTTHVNLMTTLGKFNEYMKTYKYYEAYREISYFIEAAPYQIAGYRPLYPYIVKAVCAQELNYIEEAEKSYNDALLNDPKNPDALGGLGIIGMYYGNYDRAADWFEAASKNSDPDQARMERINKVVAVLSAIL